MNLTFQNQLYFKTFVNDFFNSGMAHSLKVSRYDANDLLLGLGLNTSSSSFQPSFDGFEPGNFTFKSFDSKEKLESYIGADDYWTDSKPGVCLGFSVFESKANKIELEIMQMDYWIN